MYIKIFYCLNLTQVTFLPMGYKAHNSKVTCAVTYILIVYTVLPIGKYIASYTHYHQSVSATISLGGSGVRMQFQERL